MKRNFLLLCVLSMCLSIFAQQPHQGPQRTPEEEAMKQTIMLIHELELSDSAQIDTLYRMYLKYARLRRHGSTRQQDLDRMQSMTAEMKTILTAQQYDMFMNRQRTHGPHHPQSSVAPMQHTQGKVSATPSSAPQTPAKP